jgi:hypothetical protein
LNFIKDYENEGSRVFQNSDRRATEAKGYDRFQETAGVCPATVQSIKKSGKTMKRGLSNEKLLLCQMMIHQFLLRTGNLNLILMKNSFPCGKTSYVAPCLPFVPCRKKKRVAISPSGSKSANKPKKVYQSTSPNIVSLSSGPIIRRSAAAKMRKS